MLQSSDHDSLQSAAEREHFYIVSEPIKGLSQLPVLRVPDECAYYKEDAGKMMLGAFEPQAKPWAMNGIPDSFEFDQLPEDFDHFEPILEMAINRMPMLGEAGIHTYDNNGTYDFLEEGSQVVFDIHPSELEIFSEGDNIVLTTESNSLSTIFYQWQISSDGGASWNNVIDNDIFSGAQSNTLSMYELTKEFDQNLLQLVVSTPGYVCGSDEISEPTLLQLEIVLIPEGFSPNGGNVNDTSLIANKKELENMVKGGNDNKLLLDWRYEVFGQYYLDLVS